MVLSGAGKAFCAGYDLAHYAEGNGPNQGGAGHALGPDAGLPVHVGEHAGLHVALPGNEAGDLQGAWARRRGGIRYRAVCRPHDHGRHRANRLHAHPCLGLPDHGDVGAPAGAGKGQAHDVHG